jgi:hypothetical protein
MGRAVQTFLALVVLLAVILACKVNPNSCAGTSIKLDEEMSTATLTRCGDGKDRSVTCTKQDDHWLCTCAIAGKTDQTFPATGGDFAHDDMPMNKAIEHCGY